MHLFIEKISEVLDCKLVKNTVFNQINTISIDSRSLQNNAGTLFFALVGKNNDAHL